MNFWCWFRRAAVSALALSFTTAVVGAQTIRGDVRRTIDQTPLNGVVVLLLDQQQEIRARTLTTDDGRYALRAPGAGTYRIRTLRIGFQATITEPFELRRDTTIALALAQVPVNLPPVTAIETTTCRENPSRSQATAILWEEARTAILAADITIRELDYRFDVMLHSRKFDMRSPPELMESLFLREQHQGQQPWTSIPADTLERRGYITATDSGLQYAAPDLDVLLSPYFSRTHCFRMRDSSRTPVGQVALEFYPLNLIRRPEIRGVLWFDAESRALRSVTYSYVNLPATVRDTSAGGEIEFAQLPNGAWILPRWLIRAPIPARGAERDTLRGPGSPLSNWTLLPTGPLQTARLRITGGDIVSVSAGGTAGGPPLWQRPVSALEVKVVMDVEGGGRQPVIGATVGFAGSASQEVTDHLGVVRFNGVIEGEYLIEASTAMYGPLRVGPEQLKVRFPATTTTIQREIAVRSLPALVQRACGLDSKRAALLGSVIRDGHPVVRAPVLIEPLADTPEADQYGSAETVTGPDGRYAVCGMPQGVEFSVTVRARDGTSVRRTVRIEDLEPVTFLDVIFPGVGAER